LETKKFEGLKCSFFVFTAMRNHEKPLIHQKPISDSVYVDHRGAITMMRGLLVTIFYDELIIMLILDYFVPLPFIVVVWM